MREIYELSIRELAHLNDIQIKGYIDLYGETARNLIFKAKLLKKICEDRL